MFEAFVTKLDISANLLVYSTFLGGSHNDEGNDIALDPYGRLYVVGFTRSTDFPTEAAIQAAKGSDGCATTPCADAFLSVIEPDGQAFAYSTYLGGDQDDVARGMALGSVRQLTNSQGNITLAKSYDPYGITSQSFGSGASIYAFTGEQQDASGLTYLRARYYSNGDGRFISRDTWMGDTNSPLSLNRWKRRSGQLIA